MRGYWEMGSRGMHMAPASTMRIEQTLAKIGRRMKKFATGYFSAIVTGTGFTFIPGRTFCVPSTTIFCASSARRPCSRG